MERNIGRLKPRIKSRSNPFQNAFNALHLLQASSYFSRLQRGETTAEVNDPNSLTISIEDTVVKFLKVDTSGTLEKYSGYDLKKELLAYYLRYKILADESDMDQRILVCRKAEVRGHTFIGKKDEEGAGKEETFAKMTLPVDTNALRGTRSKTENNWKEFFGRTILLFQHTTSTVTKTLCLVHICTDTKLLNSGVPYGSGLGCRYYVTDITHLDCAVLKLPCLHRDNKYYYTYQGIIPNEIKLGEAGKI
ncbi:hypothetical protein BJV82DRAFT_625276 [Fennellomyces sp. T-0311]|nr:hypothetical protein BJV82DRAFT_625276 [Fennellomyces sp. T-0311]